MSFDASRSASSSFRPMIVRALRIRATVEALEAWITFCQYSGWRTNSFAYRYSTESGTPTARKPSLKYSAQMRKFSRFRPSLSLMYACQSARKMIAGKPARMRSPTFDPMTNAVPMCISPDGSSPTYARGVPVRSGRVRNSSRVTTPSEPPKAVWSRSSGATNHRTYPNRIKVSIRAHEGLRKSDNGLKSGSGHPTPGNWYGGICEPARPRFGDRAPGRRSRRRRRRRVRLRHHRPHPSLRQPQGRQGVRADRELPPRKGSGGEGTRDCGRDSGDRQASPRGLAGTIPDDPAPDVHHKGQRPSGRRFHRVLQGRERSGLRDPGEQLRGSRDGDRDDDAPRGRRRHHPRRGAVEARGDQRTPPHEARRGHDPLGRQSDERRDPGDPAAEERHRRNDPPDVRRAEPTRRPHRTRRQEDRDR